MQSFPSLYSNGATVAALFDCRHAGRVKWTEQKTDHVWVMITLQHLFGLFL